MALLFAAFLIKSLSVHSHDQSDSVELHINTTKISNGDWVELSWSGVQKSDRSDCWIGVFSPSTANVSAIPKPTNGRKAVWKMTKEEHENEVFDKLGSTYTEPWTHDAPIKYIMCSDADESFLNTGSGSKSFTLLNMRHDVIFWLFFNGLSSPKAIAKSPVIEFNNVYAPMHVHIARTRSASEMRISWNSKSADDNPRVRYNINDNSTDEYQFESFAESETFSRDDFCGGPANSQGYYEPGFFHTTIIKGLTPGKDTIYYVVGDDKGGWSKQFSFKAVKAAGSSSSYPMHLSVIGDVGATEMDNCHYHWEEPDADRTIKHLAEQEPELILHIGDLSYATGYETKWELFMNQIEDIAASVPYMTGQGNHEQDWPMAGVYWSASEDSGGECGKATEARFIMPTPSKDQFNGWYSIEQGPLHLTIMDTELDCGPGSDQYDWFKRDFESINRTLTPWVIFAGHRPMYYNNIGPDAPFNAFESLLMEYEIDLALWGHVHLAQATYPVFNGSRVYPKNNGDYAAPIHAVIGNGGQGLVACGNITHDWNAWCDSVWGWNHIEIKNETHLYMAFYNEDNDLLHNFTIYRKRD